MLKIKPKDKKKYILTDEIDYQILEKIYELEKCKLFSDDKKIIKFLRTQLEEDWRKPLIKFLDELSKKYKK